MTAKARPAGLFHILVRRGLPEIRTRFRPDEDLQRSRTELTNAAREGWTAFLSQVEWDYFLTVTFKLPRKDSHLALQSIIRGLSAYPHIVAFLGTELHMSGDVHAHGLLHLPEKDPSDSWRIWAALFNECGRTEAFPPLRQADVIKYTTKYCTKALTDWHILGTIPNRN